MPLLAWRGVALVAEYNGACLQQDGYELEHGAYSLVRHLDPPNEKVLDNPHGSALYCGGNDLSLPSADRIRSGIAIVVEDTSDFA